MGIIKVKAREVQQYRDIYFQKIDFIIPFFLCLLVILKLSVFSALNFEPYGLSFASSVSSSGVTGRQSPTGLSFGSDTSGNSAETGHKE